MTEKLFYHDSHRKTFTARVEECRADGEFWQAVLDATVFFPEGGGQYADTGFLDGKEVLDVQEKDGIIYHKMREALEPGQTVEGEINWELRFMKMQQHTGEHIVSGLVHKRFGYDNVGFHLGSEDCTMDFNGEITKEELRTIEWQANQAVAGNLEILVEYPDREALAKLEYRSKIEIDGLVRIVTVPGYDVCACCAPHVSRTGEIGLIKLTNVQRYKGGVRVTMLCGFRALDDYNRKERSVRAISAALCAKEDEVAEAVEHVKSELAEWKLKTARLQRELFVCQAEQIQEDTPAVVLVKSGLDGESPRILMNLVLERGIGICAVLNSTESGSYRYVIGSREKDVRGLAKELNAAFEGRGGGKPEMVQGSVKGDAEEIEGWILEKARNMDR